MKPVNPLTQLSSALHNCVSFNLRHSQRRKKRQSTDSGHKSGRNERPLFRQTALSSITGFKFEGTDCQRIVGGSGNLFDAIAAVGMGPACQMVLKILYSMQSGGRKRVEVVS